MHSPLCATSLSPGPPNRAISISNVLISSLAIVHWIELADPSSQTVPVVGALIIKYAGERNSQNNDEYPKEHGWRSTTGNFPPTYLVLGSKQPEEKKQAA